MGGRGSAARGGAGPGGGETAAGAEAVAGGGPEGAKAAAQATAKESEGAELAHHEAVAADDDFSRSLMADRKTYGVTLSTTQERALNRVRAASDSATDHANRASVRADGARKIAEAERGKPTQAEADKWARRAEGYSKFAGKSAQTARGLYERSQRLADMWVRGSAAIGEL